MERRERERKSVSISRVACTRATRERPGREHAMHNPYCSRLNETLRCRVFPYTVPEFRSSSFNEERLFNIPALSQRENREMRGRGP